MNYLSTRGGNPVTASQAILRGLAPDGGLYVPGLYPQLSLEKIAALAKMSYQERATEILSLYLEDFTREEIASAVFQAYSAERFDDPAVAPVRQMEDNTWVLELFHGPTLAFKDMALQLLPHLTRMSMQKNGEEREVSILVATSGDTGKAALEGFRDVPGTSCTVFYPMDGVSAIQKQQMVTTAGNNTHVIAVKGNFDDAQTGVKQLFADARFAAEMDKRHKVLSSANSINFGRLVPQVVYYFSAYGDLVAKGAIRKGEMVNFCVPTGNFGDILAGFYAREMGLPVHKLICASNRNNVLTDFFATGIYSTHRLFCKTNSPSMDILVSSNLERLLYEASDRNGELVSTWMRLLKECGSYSVGEQRSEWLRQLFWAGFCDDAGTLEEIGNTWQRDHYLLDTHTAVASRILRKYRAESGDETPAVLVSTASPYKFAPDVLAAVSGRLDMPDAFASSEMLGQVTGVKVPRQVLALKDLPVRHTQSCEKEAMGQAVLSAFDGKNA